MIKREKKKSIQIEPGGDLAAMIKVFPGLRLFEWIPNTRASCYDQRIPWIEIPDTRASWLPERHSQKTRFKVKRGLPGFVNGARVSALADTGCSGNSVSLAFAQEMKLALHGSPTKFVLGNSTCIKSLGRLTL